jgi:uncharacterized membrane protein YGL010W
MTSFERMFRSYESIHQSPVNRLIHAIGIPMIMVSILGLAGLLQTPVLASVGASASAATAMVIATSVIVFSWSVRAGLGYLALALACAFAAQVIAAHVGEARAPWVFAVGFVTGWAVQFVGHAFEGKSPEFVSRPQNLLLGPISVVAEVAPFVRPYRRHAI